MVSPDTSPFFHYMWKICGTCRLQIVSPNFLEEKLLKLNEIDKTEIAALLINKM